MKPVCGSFGRVLPLAVALLAMAGADAKETKKPEAKKSPEPPPPRKGEQEEDVPEGSVLFYNTLDDAPFYMKVGLKGNEDGPVFIVDTGVNVDLLLDSGFAKTLGKPSGTSLINGTVKGETYQLKFGTLGRMRLPEHPVPAVDLEMVRSGTGEQSAGVMGWPLFKKRTLVMDHRAGVFQIRSGARLIAPGADSLPLHEVEGLPYFKSVLGSKELDFLIDTGDNGSVSLSTADFDRLVKEGVVKEAEKRVFGMTLEGHHESRRGTLTGGKLLGVDLKGLRVDENPKDTCAVGMTFLLKLDLALSNTPSRISWVVRQDPRPPLALRRMMGMVCLFRDGRAVVSRVEPDGAAAKAGLVDGDEIVSLDGQKEAGLNYRKLYEACEQNAGWPLKCQILRAGEKKEVTLNLGKAPSAWEQP
ncbi:MAG: PDZ domain-containing protein [Luteolibacter sp.]